MHGRQTREAIDEATLTLTKEAALAEFVGQSQPLLEIVDRIPRIADANVTVLINGETGTGKELCARAIHYLSSRSQSPFVVENCGRLPGELIANEFFGHEQGAFTGAIGASAGLVGRAAGGTLVLDEIDSLPIGAQAVLLRFLQDKQFQRLGGDHFEDSDVRVLACTNVDLAAKVDNGSFRRDLYHRLQMVELSMPPLQERPSDIGLLAVHFLKRYAKEFDRKVCGLADGCLAKLESYHWPGNVRELEGVIQEAVLLSSDAYLAPSDLRVRITTPRTPALAPGSFQTAKAKAMEDFEIEFLRQALERSAGNISLAARVAGLNRGTFWHLLEKHRLLPRAHQCVWLAASNLIEFGLRQAG